MRQHNEKTCLSCTHRRGWICELRQRFASKFDPICFLYKEIRYEHGYKKDKAGDR